MFRMTSRHRIACLLPSLTILHYYFVLILRVAATADLDDDGRLVERGIDTDYVIVSKETSLGIAGLQSPASQITSLKSIFMLSYHPKGLIPSYLPTKNLYAFLDRSLRATNPDHLNRRDLICLIMLAEEYNACSSELCNFLHSPVA